jgi:hypothetical protein
MIKILTSSQNINEKRYVFDIIFREFLEIEYIVQIVEQKEYHIIIDNGNKIIIEDHFFYKFQGNSDYLNTDNIPQKIEFSNNEFILKQDIPIIFGNGKIEKKQDEIKCGVDIFSSIYFFLSRWEEYVSKDLDQFGRFKVRNSLAFKTGIVNRAVVNEYVEMLWAMLKYSGFNGVRKNRAFKPIITHDVDQPVRLSNLKMFAKSFIKNIIKYKNINGALSDCLIYPLNKITPKYDLANSFDFLMDVSESIGVKSYFNFQNSNKTKYDWGYDIKSDYLKSIFEKIKKRKHVIGFHPSFYSYNNPNLWKKEYEELCSVVGEKILTGRQHFLRTRVPDTWQIWEDNDLESDSSFGFAELEGFRCGTCFEFSTYNLITRKKLKLKESPLIVMEKSINAYQGVNDPNIFEQKLNGMVEEVRRYNGNLVFLWHNSSFDTKYYTHKTYSDLIQKFI